MHPEPSLVTWLKWSQLQWLVAALGVGIGFGLQEIVANFISGLIIFFERPIRVGDLVTVGESSGTVTRIRIRATTIDSFSHRFRTIVPEDCVGDHDERPHQDNLRDISRRYADVSDADACIEYIEDWRRKNSN